MCKQVCHRRAAQKYHVVASSSRGQLKSYVDATADLPWYSSPQLLCKGSLCLLWSSLQKIRFHHVWTPDLPLTSLRQLVPKLWECLVDMILAFLTAWPLWRLYPAAAKSHEIDRSLSGALSLPPSIFNSAHAAFLPDKGTHSIFISFLNPTDNRRRRTTLNSL